MAWAENPVQFKQKAALRTADLSLQIVQLRETEPWSIRNSEDDLRAELYEMESRISSNVNAAVPRLAERSTSVIAAFHSPIPSSTIAY
jgi:hypothetical protein